MIVAAFLPEESTPLSPVSYRFQKSMPPHVHYGNRNNDLLHEAKKKKKARISDRLYPVDHVSCNMKCHYIQPNHELKIPFTITKIQIVLS